MTELIRSIARLIAALTFLTLAGVNAVAGELELSANTPDITIETRPAGRNFMRLPSLEYAFSIEVTCPSTLEPASMSLSIADTRISLDADQLSATQAVSVSVTVPGSQIGPVAVNNFCTGDDAVRGEDSLIRIPAVLSAQGALLCASETASEMTYASESLGVILHCGQATETQTDSNDSE